MNARTSLALLAGVCVTLGLIRADVFTTTVARKPKTEISFWNGFTGPDGRVMLEMIREFNQANPDVNVSMQRIAWALYYNKVMVSALDGRGPELFVVHASALTRMHRAGIVADNDEAFRTIPESDFDPYVIEQTVFNGHHVAVPLDIHPQGMYCNVDMLKSLGMTNVDGSARAPSTREEFMRVAKGLMDSDGGKFGFALTNWQNNFMSLMPQFDGYYLDANGRSALNNPNNVAALTFLGNLRNKEHLIPPPDNQVSAKEGRHGLGRRLHARRPVAAERFEVSRRADSDDWEASGDAGGLALFVHSDGD